MAQQIINVGTNPNDGTGDTLRGAFIKTDDNFTELYSGKQNTLVSGTNIKTINGNSLLGSGDLTISGGITGSGTDNYIPRFNGTTALENSQIYDNGTGVAVGTSTPHPAGVKFLIYEASTPTIVGYFQNNNSICYTGYHSSTTTLNAVRVGAQGNNLLFSVSSDGSPAERMRITSSGNVGIGTTSPYSKLHVYGGNIKIEEGSGGDEKIEVSGGYLAKYNGLDNAWGFAQDKIYIDGSTSNVGIGTSSPDETLHVNGNLKIADGSTIKLHITDTILNGIIGGNGFMIDNTTTQFGIDVGSGGFFGIKADSNVYFQNIAGEYFGLNSNESQLICYSSLMNAASPGDPSTITNWIQVKDENGSKFYLPLYQ